MTWLFTQVWLWSLAAFVLGALLSWLLFVPRLRRQVRWLRAELAEVPEDEDLPPERDGVGWLTPEPAERLDEEVGFGRWDRGPRDWDRARMYGSTERFGPVRSAHEGTEPEVEVPVEQPPAAEQDDSELRLEEQREAGSSGRTGAPNAGGPNAARPNAAGPDARGPKAAGPGTTTPKPVPPKPAEDPTAPAEGEITDTELVEHPPEPESTENTWFRKPDLPEAPEDEWTGVLEPEPAPVTNGHALSGEIDVDEVRPELPKRLPGVGPRPGPSEVSGVRIPGEPRKTEPSESGPSESGSSESGSSGGGPSEGQSSETGSSETGLSETGPSGRGLFEPGKTETGSSETAASEKGQSETGPSEKGQLGTGPADSGPSGAGQSATGQATAGQPGTGRSGSGQPGTGRSGSGQPTTGQPTADQPTADQPTTGQPTTGQPEPPPLPRAPELPTGPGRTEPSRAGMVKGHFASHRYHTPDSPEYGEIDPDVWFRTAADAEQAGFEPWDGSGRA